MRYQKMGNSAASYRKAAMLSVLLIMVIAVYYFLNRHQPGSGKDPFTDNYIYNDINKFNDSLKLKITKSFAGFWTYEPALDNNPVQKWDHVEFKDNGYIWQVVVWTIALPSGDTTSITHVRLAYLVPFGQVAGDSTVVCDVYILKQAYIVGKDTCYGESQSWDTVPRASSNSVCETWEVRRSDSSITFNKRTYKPYTGEITEFFPAGDVDVPDLLSLNKCHLQSGEGMTQFVKTFLSRSFTAMKPQERSDADVAYLITSYYKPVVVISGRSFPDSVGITLAVAQDGHVASANPIVSNLIKGEAGMKFAGEVKTWVFPPALKGNERFTYIFRLRR
jgi:hypothetical protein